MEEKFKPFKELLKALREIKYAIEGGGNNSGEGNGNDIVLPKYVLCSYSDNSSSSPSSSSSSSSQSEFSESNPSESNPEAPGIIFPGSSVPKVLEIDYSGKLVDIINTTDEEFDNLSEEEITNLTEYSKNYTTNPPYHDTTKQWPEISAPVYLYTKEQIDIINKNSIIQLYNDMITKLDNNVVIDIVDIRQSVNDIQRGQYYCIMTKTEYDKIINMEPLPDLPTQPGR